MGKSIFLPTCLTDLEEQVGMMKVKSVFFGNSLLLLYVKTHLNVELLEHVCRNVYSLGFGCLFPDDEGCWGSVRGALSQAAASQERPKPARRGGGKV